jgi:hypothetical protein
MEERNCTVRAPVQAWLALLSVLASVCHEVSQPILEIHSLSCNVSM